MKDCTGEIGEAIIVDTRYHWERIVSRCTNEDDVAYPRYGGAGITIDEKWLDFQQFLTDMGTRPSIDHSVDLIDPSLGYSLANCRWSRPMKQTKE